MLKYVSVIVSGAFWRTLLWMSQSILRKLEAWPFNLGTLVPQHSKHWAGAVASSGFVQWEEKGLPLLVLVPPWQCFQLLQLTASLPRAKGRFWL